MDQTTLILNRVLPIFILIGLGFWIRRRRFLSESTVDDLRRIAANLALPAVLFLSFLEIQFQPGYLVLIALMFFLCLALLGLGHGLQRRLRVRHAYFPFLMTGFEYGMLGVSLFGSAYGLERIGAIAVTDLGHELFIWFVFLGLLLVRRDGLSRPAQLASAFFRSPVIIAILAGIALNLLGARAFLYEAPLTGAVMASLGFLSNLTIPLILIIVGHGIRLNWAGLRDALLVIGVRMVVLLPLALILNAVLIRGLLHLEPIFEAAVFTLLILPPPFIIPLYMPAGLDDERAYVNNILTLYTVVSIIIFALYIVATA